MPARGTRSTTSVGFLVAGFPGAVAAALAICLVTLAIVTKFKNVQEPLVILVTGAVGLGISSFTH